MTDPRMTPTNDAPVTVEQCDREAAALLIEGRSDLISNSQPDWCAIDQKRFRAGAKDGHLFVQAFARHRLAALSSAPAGDGEAEVRDEGPIPEARSSLIARAVRQSLRKYGHRVAESSLPECIASDVEATLRTMRDDHPALARPRAAVGEREAIEALAPYAASVLSIIGAKSRRDNEKHITRADGTGITYGMLRAILALQSPPAKVEG